MRHWMAEKRTSKKLTQAELAAMVGVSQRAIAAYERGERTPTVRVAKLLGEALGEEWTRFYDEMEKEAEA